MNNTLVCILVIILLNILNIKENYITTVLKILMLDSKISCFIS
jgi:hypothetical protein